VRIFKTKWFARWAKSEKIADEIFKNAIKEIEAGLHNGDMGACLIKKRVARKGEGRRGGYRTLLSFKQDKLAIFIFGFSKNDAENITKLQEEKFKKLSRDLQASAEKHLKQLLEREQLIEVE